MTGHCDSLQIVASLQGDLLQMGYIGQPSCNRVSLFAAASNYFIKQKNQGLHNPTCTFLFSESPETINTSPKPFTTSVHVLCLIMHYL